MKIIVSSDKSHSEKSTSSASYYLKGGAVILGTGALYAVAKTTGALSWLWSGIEAYTSGAIVSEEKAMQTISSALQDAVEPDPLLISPLKSVSSRRVEELDSLDLVDLDRELGKDVSNPVISKKVLGDESEVIHLDTQDGIRVPQESHYIGRRLLMTPSSEFIVNNYTLGNQSDPAVATSSDGEFVITWTSNGEDGSEDGVYAQVFNISTGRLGSEFRVNTYTQSNQNQPAIAMQAADEVMITWTSYQDIDSVPMVNPCLSGSYCAFVQSTYPKHGYYTSLPDCSYGNYASNYGTSYSLNMNQMSLGIYANSFLNTSIQQPVIGAEFRVDNYGFNDQQYSAIALFANSNYLIVWESTGPNSYSFGCCNAVPGAEPHGCTIYGITTLTYCGCDAFQGTTVPQDGSGFGIFARRFFASGGYGPDFQINTYNTGDQRLPSVAAFLDDESIIAWQSEGQDSSGWGIFAQRFAATGARIGSEFEVNNFIIGDQTNPAITTFSNGGFAVVWQSYAQDGSGWGIFARLFDHLNFPLGNDFQVNSYWVGDQMSPAITSFQSGEFVIVWQSYAQDGSGFGIYGQRFSAQGVPFQSEFQINSYTTSDQADPAIVAWGITGSFVVSWDSYLQDGSGTAVVAKVYENDVMPTLSYADPFNIVQYGNISVTTAFFNIMGDHPSTQLIITITDLQHAIFQLQGHQATQFSEQDILNGTVVLLQDGSAEAPSFNFTASDGFYSIGPIAANVNFTITQLPAIVNNYFYVLQGRTQRVTLDNLSGFDPRPGITSTDLTFTIAITGAQFSLTDDQTQAVTQFTQAQINSGQIELTQEGAELIPFGTVSISDGFLTSAPQPLQVVLDTKPTIINNRLSLKPDQTISVIPSDILTSDDRTLAPSLILSVSNVTEGYFARVTATDTSIFSFSQDDINLEKIIFTHTGGHHAPGFLLTVTDSSNLTAGPQSAQIIFDDPAVNNGTTTIVKTTLSTSFRNTIIGAVLSGAIGLGFFAFKFWMSHKATKYLENAATGESGDKEYQKKVIQPIAKQVFAHIKMTGFLGYVNDRTMKQAYAAIVGLVRECAAQGVEVDLRKLSEASQTFLIATIAEKTREKLVAPISYCSAAYAASFFHPEVTPPQITGKKTEIATAVKAVIGRQSIVIPRDPEIKEFDTRESKAMVRGATRSDDSNDIELDVMIEQTSEGTEGAVSPRVSKVAFLPAIEARFSRLEASIQVLESRFQGELAHS